MIQEYPGQRICGSSWDKKDTSYYAVYYTENYGGRTLDVVTNDFGEWLKQENKSRVKEVGKPYDEWDFHLESVDVFFRKGDLFT